MVYMFTRPIFFINSLKPHIQETFQVNCKSIIFTEKNILSIIKIITAMIIHGARGTHVMFLKENIHKLRPLEIF